MISSRFTHQRHGFEKQFSSQFGDGFQNWFMKMAGRLHGLFGGIAAFL